MRQLVREKTLPFATRRRIMPGSEDDVRSHGVSLSRYGLRGQRRNLVGVYPYPAEVMAEPRLHEGACRRIESLTG